MPEPRKKLTMQDVRFASVEDFLAYLPEDELKLTEILRDIVFECIPNVKEKLSYNVPFYSLRKRICFIWPASVLWGKKQTYTGVRFGLTSGYLLADEHGYLEQGDRKQVYWRDIKSQRDIQEPILKELLYQAVEVDKG